jgi:gliding motility-associated-like protein
VPNAPAQATATLIQPDCTNANGTITVTAPLSTDYEYSIDGTTFQSGLVFNVSTSGSYTITVRNTITGCTSVSLPFVINAVTAAPAQATATLVQPDCTNANGTITVTAPLSADFEYSIDGTTFQSGLVFNISTAGSYTITVRNTISGCTSVSLPFVINAVPNAPAQATATLIQPDCTNANGTITVTAPLSADYEYSIDGTTFQSGLTFNVSTAGSYTITVRNTITGCTSVSLPFVINAVPNAPAQATATLIQPDCTNSNGTITVTAPLSADYEYSIDGTTFQSGLVFNVSTAGSYTITTRNTITGCTSVSLPFVINAVPNAPAQATATSIQPDCTNANGTITVTAPLSTDYEYSIDGTTFQSGLVFNVSTSGSYTITVRNTITGCTSVSLPFVINAVPSAPAQATATLVQPDCANANGAITVTAPISADFEYSIDGTTFQSGLVFNVSTAGSYTITVRNTITGCTSVSLPFVINAVPNAPAQATATLVQPDCANANGTITVTAPLSTDYEYSIDGTTFQSGLVFTVSTAGSYNITVRNTITGCTSVSLPFVINAPLSGLPQLTGAQGCVPGINGSSYMLEGLALNNSFNIADVTFEWRLAGETAVIGNDATFNATEYKNNNGLTSQDFPLQFELTVTTNGGCTDTYIFTVESIVCDIPKGISPNNDNRNDSFDLSGMNVSHLTIVNRYGLEVYHRSNYRNEWHGQTDNDQDLPTGTYFYMVQLPDGTRTGWVYLNRETR